MFWGQELGRLEDQKIAGTKDEVIWNQNTRRGLNPQQHIMPVSHNKVIETAHHSIELDDTPDGERIMIHHKSGSFVQIDSVGTRYSEGGR